MTPGLAATSYAIDGAEERVPVAEYNKKSIPVGNSDSTKNLKPQHPFTEVLQEQGLLKDDIRGITTSSARREVPSSVFGISTPGPLDKRSGAPKARVGKAEHAVPGAPISRLGGTTFVMDDGDDKFLRKTPASEGPPEYASVEQNETDGDRTIPHNELVRIRTRTGHQILLHNSEDLIYIGNARGTTWIELSSNGKIDIFAEDSISIHTENDLNITADRDINFNAGRNVNINAAQDSKITSGGNSHINSGGNHTETAGEIHMNGPEAEKAATPIRIPAHEPWAEHENLDPLKFTPDLTEAVAPPTEEEAEAAAEEEEVVAEPAEFFEKYTTSTDTFAKIKGTED